MGDLCKKWKLGGDVQPEIRLWRYVNSKKLHDLLILASIDDSLGDPLTVLWEAEAGAEAIDFDDLPQPEAFDDPETLDAFLVI